MGLDVNDKFNMNALGKFLSFDNIQNLLQHSKMNIQSIFEEYAGSDGKLDRNEVEKCISVWNLKGTFNADQIFKALDGDGDNYITLEEIKAYSGNKLGINISDNDTLSSVLLNVAGLGGGVGSIIAGALGGIFGLNLNNNSEEVAENVGSENTDGSTGEMTSENSESPQIPDLPKPEIGV